MLATPQFFYFDLGNVLLNFDHEIACRQMAECAGISQQQVREIVFESDLEWRYERGDVTTRQFYDEFCRQSHTQPDFEALKHAAASIFELNSSIEPVVTALKRAGHRLGILSNTNETHWEYISDGRFAVVSEPFEIYALSYEMRAMKPEATIYPAAAEMAGHQPEEIFFVDDRQENVAAACQAGFDAVQYVTTESLVDQLQDRGVI